MVLDSNLFTLAFERRPKEPTILDLVPFASSSIPNAARATTSSDVLGSGHHPEASVDSISASTGQAGLATSPTPYYTFSRAKAGHYSVRLVDPLTEIVLASVECPTSNDKIKTVVLYNPDEEVVLEKRSNTFKQEWRWTWEEDAFSIRRDGRAYVVEAVRKPDPEIDVARYTPATRSRPAVLQFLDYNIRRLEVNDRRGLEMLAVLATLQCLDQEYDERHKEGGSIYTDGIGSSSWARMSSTARDGQSSSSDVGIKGQQSSSVSGPSPSLEPNEIPISLHIANDYYVDHALHLLRQDEQGQGLHMIILCADAPGTTMRAVAIAAEVKARWYKLPPMAKGRTLDPMPGNSSQIADDLYQYVRDPAVIQRKEEEMRSKEQSQRPASTHDSSVGPRGRIKLDAPASAPAPLAPAPSNASTSTHKAKAAKKKDHVYSVQGPPSNLRIYLCKDRIDEFERLQSSAEHSSDKARPSPAPASRPAPPHIPPKIQPQPQGSEASSNGAKKILGRLGIRSRS